MTAIVGDTAVELPPCRRPEVAYSDTDRATSEFREQKHYVNNSLKPADDPTTATGWLSSTIEIRAISEPQKTDPHRNFRKDINIEQLGNTPVLGYYEMEPPRNIRTQTRLALSGNRPVLRYKKSDPS